MRKQLLTALFICIAVLCSAQDNCFGIIAGRSATVDGSVLMAHNEDDGGEQMLNIYVAPATEKSLRYIWCEFPGSQVADSFMNQFGVSVASDNCPSREDKGELVGKGILYEVRKAVAKYARSAREGVTIIGNLVETFGYSGSGRSYLIADINEAWVVAVVKGKHWVAQRVPDDKVMVIPNYYVIGEVDLDDEENFAGCDDLINYAVSRGWYDPKKDGEFNFAKAYASESSLSSSSNTIRRHEAWTYFFGQDRPGEFASVPLKKVSIRDMMNVLALHEPLTPAGEIPAGICNNNTVASNVFQLRGRLGFEKGCVMWTAMGHPCCQVYYPFYCGMTEAPALLHRFSTAEEAEQKHFSDAKDMQKNYPDHFYWDYAQNWNPSYDPSQEQRAVFSARKKFEKENRTDFNEFVASFFKK